METAAGTEPRSRRCTKSVVIFLWRAGPAEGVAGDLETARRRAAGFMPRAGDTAVVEQAHFILGIRSLCAGYEKTAGVPCWEGRRHTGGQVTWRLCAPAREPTAA